MAVSDETLARASAMGERAGVTWRDTGVPQPNPFDRDQLPELAQAWRAAYLKAAQPKA